VLLDPLVTVDRDVLAPFDGISADCDVRDCHHGARF
jgi:hypothetical protein